LDAVPGQELSEAAIVNVAPGVVRLQALCSDPVLREELQGAVNETLPKHVN
jgi:hypothetical protein